MVWVEIVCDSCCDNTYGESYRQGSIKKLKDMAKENGWKITKGKAYCPKCQLKLSKSAKEISN